jgi:transaldolase
MLDINKALLAGADILTVPFKFLKQMTENPKTEQTIREFNDSWREMREKNLIQLDEDHQFAERILTLVHK